MKGSMKPQIIKKLPNPDGTFNISVQENKLLDKAKVRNTAIFKEQIAYQRSRAIKQYGLQIKQKEREIEFKKDQLKTKICLEAHADFKDGLKPLFYLENDIENIGFEIVTLKDNIKKLKEEQEKDVREGKKDV